MGIQAHPKIVRLALNKGKKITPMHLHQETSLHN
jgi:hypothetical protein